MVVGGGCRGEKNEPKSSYPDQTQRAWCCRAHGSSEVQHAWANCVNNVPVDRYSLPKSWEGCWTGGSTFYSGATHKLSSSPRATSEPPCPHPPPRTTHPVLRVPTPRRRNCADPPKWELVKGTWLPSKFTLSFDTTSVNLVEANPNGKIYQSQFDATVSPNSQSTAIRLVNDGRKWTFSRTACP